jgi:hypothetical protein
LLRYQPYSRDFIQALPQCLFRYPDLIKELTRRIIAMLEKDYLNAKMRLYVEVVANYILMFGEPHETILKYHSQHKPLTLVLAVQAFGRDLQRYHNNTPVPEQLCAQARSLMKECLATGELPFWGLLDQLLQFLRRTVDLHLTDCMCQGLLESFDTVTRLFGTLIDVLVEILTISFDGPE